MGKMFLLVKDTPPNQHLLQETITRKYSEFPFDTIENLAGRINSNLYHPMEIC